jgi:hypothetical protein
MAEPAGAARLTIQHRGGPQHQDTARRQLMVAVMSVSTNRVAWNVP